jgi:hypothetical protein
MGAMCGPPATAARDLRAVDAGDGWLVPAATPGHIESPSNSSTDCFAALNAFANLRRSHRPAQNAAIAAELLNAQTLGERGPNWRLQSLKHLHSPAPNRAGGGRQIMEEQPSSPACLITGHRDAHRLRERRGFETRGTTPNGCHASGRNPAFPSTWPPGCESDALRLRLTRCEGPTGIKTPARQRCVRRRFSTWAFWPLPAGEFRK